ncbi:hypothetical protein C1752_00475 [Acaryochloris thomasi RCC1774]|uniref:DUF1350 domain-containing protein n=1 Tax=Acaryochloris thomasi RCC1774 TaxID=1764569 RepID=A0A2W1JZ06_9CYAN|nr:DUF1350 family protein [Acaryochloris thomasi]PZD75182.1 hypothetical protein C1752_00475 [Acaryochloris thomasi RCC1774]
MPNFRPISNSWVARHPSPKGVIQFIGGTLVGSYPTWFYKSLLQDLFDQEYTIVALPFRFTFRHWSVALSLLKEQQAIRQELCKISQSAGVSDQTIELYQDRTQYSWVGHSLGCKYIALLELLIEWQRDPQHLQKCINKLTANPGSQIAQIKTGYRSLIESAAQADDQPVETIIDQVSILLAPVISDTKDAIPLPFLPQLIDGLGLGATPTQEETLKLIGDNSLFNLTGLIDFQADTCAGNRNSKDKNPKTVPALLSILQDNKPLTSKNVLAGGHGRPWSPKTKEIAEIVVAQIQTLRAKAEAKEVLTSSAP